MQEVGDATENRHQRNQDDRDGEPSQRPARTPHPTNACGNAEEDESQGIEVLQEVDGAFQFGIPVSKLIAGSSVTNRFKSSGSH
jgi:hypothetical protein